MSDDETGEAETEAPIDLQKLREADALLDDADPDRLPTREDLRGVEWMRRLGRSVQEIAIATARFRQAWGQGDEGDEEEKRPCPNCDGGTIRLVTSTVECERCGGTGWVEE